MLFNFKILFYFLRDARYFLDRRRCFSLARARRSLNGSFTVQRRCFMYCFMYSLLRSVLLAVFTVFSTCDNDWRDPGSCPFRGRVIIIYLFCQGTLHIFARTQFFSHAPPKTGSICLITWQMSSHALSEMSDKKKTALRGFSHSIQHLLMVEEAKK